MFVFQNKLWKDFKKCLVIQGENSFLFDTRKKYFRKGNPFETIEKFVEEEKGIKFGYISYNLSRFAESLKIQGEDDIGIPDCVLVSLDQKKYENISIPKGSYKISIPNINTGKEQFISGVIEAKRHIYNGDIYQVNLSRRIEIECQINAYSLFSNYIRAQPIRFPAFLEFPDLGFSIGSGSMEIFLEKKDSRIRECPIKGTRKIQEKDPEVIKKISDELLNDEKEIAENLMIVDMVRNDLGKVCKIGTVRPRRLFDVEKYETLIHLVSEVEGELEKNQKISDILIATFPAASITGAPKKSAMEIIEKIEKKRRGPYCGAISMFDESGDFIMLVSIRIFLYLHRGKLYYWTGCGIVWDSDPYKEWEETLTKTKAFINALQNQVLPEEKTESHTL